MSNAGHEMIMQAAADLDRKQQRLREIRQELAKTSTKVSSVDNMLTVELDAAGELASIKFNSQKYRRVAPAELSSILVETIRRARAQSRERIVSAYQDVLPAGLGLNEAKEGRLDLDQMFDEARREASEMVASLRGAGNGLPRGGYWSRGGAAR